MRLNETRKSSGRPLLGKEDDIKDSIEKQEVFSSNESMTRHPAKTDVNQTSNQNKTSKFLDEILLED